MKMSVHHFEYRLKSLVLYEAYLSESKCQHTTFRIEHEHLET